MRSGYRPSLPEGVKQHAAMKEAKKVAEDADQEYKSWDLDWIYLVEYCGRGGKSRAENGHCCHCGMD